jgi:hypothetical protein
MDIDPKYKCPSCERAILNRKIDKCLYCDASLRGNLLFTQSEIEKLDSQQRAFEEQQKRERIPQTGGTAPSGAELDGLADTIIDSAIDTVIDNAINIASDIASDLGGLFD